LYLFSEKLQLLKSGLFLITLIIITIIITEKLEFQSGVENSVRGMRQEGIKTEKETHADFPLPPFGSKKYIHYCTKARQMSL